MRLVVAGLPVTVRAASQAHARALTALWSRCSAYDVHGVPADEVVIHDSSPDVGAAGLTRITSKVISEHAGTHLMFHATGLADASGRVAALVGRSGSGKTTAAIQLGRETFSYVTDETVVVQSDGSVLPFPRPLAVAERGSTKKRVHSPDELGLRDFEGPLHLARVLVLDRQEEAPADPRFEEVDLLSGISELIPQMSALAAMDRPLQRLADLITRCGGVFRFSFTALGDDEAQALQDLLDAEFEAKDPWQPLDRPEDTDVARNTGLRDLRIRRGGALDGIRVGQEALLLVGSTPIRLSGLGMTIWEAAADAPTFDDLVERVVTEHGPHPEAESLVREAVESMVAAKVLGYGSPVTVKQFLASMAPQLAVASDNACSGGGA